MKKNLFIIFSICFLLFLFTSMSTNRINYRSKTIDKIQVYESTSNDEDGAVEEKNEDDNTEETLDASNMNNFSTTEAVTEESEVLGDKDSSYEEGADDVDDSGDDEGTDSDTTNNNTNNNNTNTDNEESNKSENKDTISNDNSNSDSNSKPTTVITNPQTGMMSFIITLMIYVSAIVLGIYYLRKYNKI